MLPWYAMPVIVIGGVSAVCCGFLAATILFVEVYDHIRDRDAEQRVRDHTVAEEPDPITELDREFLSLYGIRG